MELSSHGGDNSLGQVDVPEGLSNVFGIIAGGGHSLALRTAPIDSDGDVVSAGYNPNTSYTALFNLIRTNGVATQEGIGLFSESAMMDLNLGGVTLRRSGSTVNLRLQIQSKMNLVDPQWHNEGTETFILDMPGNKVLMRIRALGPQ